MGAYAEGGNKEEVEPSTEMRRKRKTGMSWSINLGGSKDQVQDELESAIAILSEAAEQVEKCGSPVVNVSAYGSAYSALNGDSSVSNSYTVSGSTPTPPEAPTAQDEPTAQAEN